MGSSVEIVDQTHVQNPLHSDDEQTWLEPLSPLSRDIEFVNVDVDSYLSQKRRTFWKKIRKLLLRLNRPLQV